MKTVVDVGFGARALVVVIDDLPQGLSAHLHREGQHRGISAAQRGQRAAAKIVRDGTPLPRLLIHVAMTVDSAGKHESPDGIDGLAGLHGIRHR